MKKLAACLLLCFLLALAGVACADGFAFDAAAGAITGWQGEETAVTIPESIGGIRVVSVAPEAFSGLEQLETVAFPSGLQAIGEYAFSGCTSLNYLIFQNITLPAIADGAFDACPLADVDLPWHATKQQADEARDTLQTAGINANVWRGNVPWLHLPEGDYLYEKDGRKGYRFTRCQSGQTDLFLHYALIGQDGETVPVYGLGEAVFLEQKQLKRFGVPHSGSFTTIGKEAFADSGLEWIDLYDTVTTIGESAFRNCTALKSLALSESLQQIGAGAFSGCTGLTELTILCDNSVLPRNAFADCTALATVTIDTHTVRAGLMQSLPVSSVTFGESVSTIGKNAFQATALTSLVLPENIRKVESGAFDHCLNLESVTVLCDASVLPADAFAGCTALKHITFAKGSIPADLLKNSSIETLSLGEGVGEIGQRAFSGTPLTGVVLPAGIRLQNGAFAGVEPENIRIADNATEQQIDAASKVLERPWYMPLLRESDRPELMHMPELPSLPVGFTFDAATGSILSYNGNETALVIPKEIDGAKVRSIVSLAGAAGSPNPIERIVIPETVTQIAPAALKNCSALRSVLCYGPLDVLGANAFEGCTSLRDALFVNGIHTIEDFAFDGCIALEQLWWKGAVNRLGAYALRNTAITDFALRVRRFGEGALSACPQLRTVHLRSCTERVETLLLDGCTAMDTLCLEWNDEEIFARFARPANAMQQVQVILPADTNLKRLQAMYRVLSTGNGGPVEMRDEILLADCTEPVPEMPDIEAVIQAIFSRQ